MNLITVKKKLAESLIPQHLRTAGIIPVLAYCEESYAFLTDDQSIGFGFVCEPLCVADEKFQERVNGFLNQEFPPGSTLQFILFRSPDIDYQMQEMLELRNGAEKSLLMSVIKERVDFLNHHTGKPIYSRSHRGIFNSGLIQDLKLFVTCKIPIKGHTPTENELLELQALRTKVESSLQTVQLRPRPLTAERYVRAMNTLLNWSDPAWRHGAVGWEQDKPLCGQLFDYRTDIEVSKRGLKLGDGYVKVLSAKKLPDVAYFGDALSYIGDVSGGNACIKENYMVVVNLLFPEAEKTRYAIERKRQFTVNQAYGPMLKFVPVLADKKEGFDILYESMKEGAKPIKIAYSVVLFAPTQARVEATATATRNIWRELKVELMEDQFVTLAMFLNCLPLGTDKTAVQDLFRYKTMTTEQAAVLLPIFGEWKGTGTYHAALISRNGQIMSLSLHDSTTNKNLVIAAESGSGKSFLINELIFSYLSEGAQVWVIDAGKSYQKLAEMLGGISFILKRVPRSASIRSSSLRVVTYPLPKGRGFMVSGEPLPHQPALLLAWWDR